MAYDLTAVDTALDAMTEGTTLKITNKFFETFVKKQTATLFDVELHFNNFGDNTVKNTLQVKNIIQNIVLNTTDQTTGYIFEGNTYLTARETVETNLLALTGGPSFYATMEPKFRSDSVEATTTLDY